MTDAKTPAPKTAKDAPKDDAKNVTTTKDVEKAKSGERDDVADGQQVMERGDIGAAAGPGKPEVVKVITEVRPGLAN